MAGVNRTANHRLEIDAFGAGQPKRFPNLIAHCDEIIAER